jgi:putative FmdB family regulatory protein
MPLYEYDCGDCGTTFERLRPMSKSDAPANCAICSSANTTRAISLFSAISKSSNGGSHTVGGTGGGCARCGGTKCATCNH